MVIQPFEQRLAEIWIVKKSRALTLRETTEFGSCMDLLAKHATKMALLQNFSIMAHVTNDMDWQHEICADIDALESGIPVTKKRSNAVERSTED